MRVQIEPNVLRNAKKDRVKQFDRSVLVWV